MSDLAIQVYQLSKRYRVGQPQSYKTVRESITNAFFRRFNRTSSSSLLTSEHGMGAKHKNEYIWALRDVSIDFRRGEIVGFIGRNGAGKSTFLKILSRITAPTMGYAEIRGRTGSLLEVGTGFHPELTGRENTYLNGAILGMRREEIDSKFDEIVSFAEVEKFIDTPVKRYSSGMQVRLAFSVAAHLEPEVLLVDEVLAVGDAAFQEKCLGRMQDVSGEGRLVLFVSHNMGAVLKLCNRVVWIDEGRVVRDGSPDIVVESYLQEVLDRQNKTAREGQSLEGHPGRRKNFDSVVRLTHCRIEAGEGNEEEGIATGSKCHIVLGYKTAFSMNGDRVSFGLVIRGEAGTRLASCWSEVASDKLGDLGTQGEMICQIPRFPFVPGRYTVDIGCRVSARWSDFIYEAAGFEVINGAFYPSNRLPDPGMGQCLIEYEWKKTSCESSHC